MFRRTAAYRISAYALLMKETAGSPRLKGLPIPDRGKALSAIYRNLNKSELEALKKRAKAVPSAPRALKARRTRPPTLFSTFVKEHTGKFQGSAPQRLKEIAKLWKAKK